MDVGKLKKVHVVVRVRPQVADKNVWVKVIDQRIIQTVNHRNINETLEYMFEHVYGPESSQQEVYDRSVSGMIQHVLEGQNTSVFAYGPTGAGKTFTIMGTETNPGLIPRCIDGLFAKIQEESSRSELWKTELAYSYMEIYNEKVQDLLDLSNSDLPIRVDQHKNIVVSGLSQQPISSVQQFMETFTPASKNRTTASTKLNNHSSRSHSILLLSVSRTQQVAPYKKLRGKLYIIDLAGSEDNRRTGNQGIRLKESTAINTSLLALGQVVNALNKGQACIPYRDSKLTRLLADSLGGSAHAVMVVNLSPEEEHFHDTAATLNFARKAKKIVNTVLTHETVEKPVCQERSKRSLDTASEDDSVTDESSPVTPPAVKRLKKNPVAAPFLSPLLRNQHQFKDELREEMLRRLEQLEDRLVSQMHEAMNPAPAPQGQQVEPDSTTPHEPAPTNNMLNKLDNLMTQLKESKDKGVPKPPVSSVTKRRQSPRQKVFRDGSRLKASVTVDDVTCSPMFTAPDIIRRKKVRSTAAKRSPKTADRSLCETPQKENRVCFNPEKQKARNVSVLNLLNTGNKKDLQSLQTVGAKRANLIYEYRGINGNFTSFKELLQIPGITKKYLESFLRGNLVDLSV